MKEKNYLKGMIISGWKKIEPRDWYYEDYNWKEISYGSFRDYVNRLWIKNLKRLRGDFMYGKREEKKDLRKTWFIKDYFEYLF